MIATPISWRGVIAAPVTPFSPDGSTLDLEAVEGTVERQLAAGVTGLMPCGTTGENAMLTGIERRELIARVAAVVDGRVPVIAGTGTSATASTVAICEVAPRVVAIKDSTSDVDWCQAVARRLGVRIAILCAELSLALGEELRRLGVDTSTPGVDHSIAHTGPQGSTLVTP